MTRDEQARARLVEIALATAATDEQSGPKIRALMVEHLRTRAGFKNPRAGSWCAAGLTAAMEDAGLVVPPTGTPARRGAVALLDWVRGCMPIDEPWHVHIAGSRNGWNPQRRLILPEFAQPGDIIAWLQYPPGKDPAGWRRGHVALIVAVDDESITTVGWNEGASPGRVMKRRLWRDPETQCKRCVGHGWHPHSGERCSLCDGRRKVSRSSTVLHRKPNGLLYGIARPVAA